MPVQDQMSGEPSSGCETHLHGSSAPEAISLSRQGKRTWLLQLVPSRRFRASLCFGNFKLEGSERIRNVSLESCSQIFEKLEEFRV